MLSTTNSRNCRKIFACDLCIPVRTHLYAPLIAMTESAITRMIKLHKHAFHFSRLLSWEIACNNFMFGHFQEKGNKACHNFNQILHERLNIICSLRRAWPLTPKKGLSCGGVEMARRIREDFLFGLYRHRASGIFNTSMFRGMSDRGVHDKEVSKTCIHIFICLFIYMQKCSGGHGGPFL